MIFWIADVKTLFLAGLLCGLLLSTKAQSTGGGQHIVFSSPDGQITSNAPLPMAQAPQPREMQDLQGGDVTIQPFSEPMAAPMFPAPAPMQTAEKRDDFQNPMDVRKQMGELTAAQIMNVPTPEQIFGLAEKNEELQRKSMRPENSDTNGFGFNANATIDDPGWTKTWTEDPGRSTGASNTTERASGIFGGFFDSARNDNSQNDNGFAAHDVDDSETFVSSSQPASQPSPWESGLASGALTPSTPAPNSTLNNFAMAGTSAGSAFASQSPFTPPQLSAMSTMEMLPRLPKLPPLPGQIDQSIQPAAAAPSWAPKPPPWTTPQTALGTPIGFEKR